FPVGTVLVKHFEMDTTAGTRRLETRVLIQESAGVWAGYAYEWNSAQTDADLLAGADTIALTTARGAQTYQVPSRADCLRCHTGAAGFVLGVRTLELNREFAYAAPGVTDNQLRAWNHVGLFAQDIGAASGYRAMPDPADTAAPVADRARAYLAANCAQCHRPG